MIKKPPVSGGFFVRMKGFEPSHQRRCHLKAVRLPVSPHPQWTIFRLACKENKTLLLILDSIKLKLSPFFNVNQVFW